MSLFAPFGPLSLSPLLFSLPFLPRLSSSDGQFVRWNAPTLPTADIFFSPCTFPMVYPFGSRARKAKHIGRLLTDDVGGADDDSFCHTKHQIPFICDLHRALGLNDAHDVLRLARVYQKHAAVLRDFGGPSSPAFVVLIVRQLAQPISTASVTRNSTEFGCLFRFMCWTMSEEMVHKFVRSTKVFLRLYAHVIFNRWAEHRNSEFGANCPMVLAIVLLEGLINNPKRMPSVTLHTDNANLSPLLANAQSECTNMLLQGNRLVDVLIDLTNHVGFAIRDFHSTKGVPRQHTVPKWAWAMALVALSLAFLALVTEWAVVRRVRTKKGRTVELGGIKAVIKSKTHIIF